MHDDSKTCSKCGEDKPLSRFHRNKASKDGRGHLCKPCERERRMAWYRENRETNLAYQREWREKNQERKRAYVREWREANHERKLANDAAWREANRERLPEYFRKRHQAKKDDPAYRADRERRRRERRAKQHGADIDPVTFDQILQRDLGICGICRKQITERRVELDHIIPLVAGGAHTPENLQLAHPTCNRRKSAKVNYTLADTA